MARRRFRFSGGWVGLWSVVGAVALVAVVLGLANRSERTETPAGGLNSTVTGTVETSAADRQYQAAVQEIFRGWGAPSTAPVDYAGMHRRLVELVVPGRFQTVHLDLVIALNLLQQGQAGSEQADIEEGLERLEAVFAAQPWIRENAAAAPR
ncbi:MAG: hypothetical protein PHI63_04210 [Patescibacteria group bacterium]|nr:hypothetical protein [Patescibacteria group bacterium]